jgi:hypothetical protein
MDSVLPHPKKLKKKTEKLYFYIKRGELSTEFSIVKYETAGHGNQAV